MIILEFVGRVLLSALFLIEGLGKISMQEDVIMYMEDYGVPGILFMPATILESAKSYVGEQKVTVEDLLIDIQEAKRELETERDTLQRQI